VQGCAVGVQLTFYFLLHFNRNNVQYFEYSLCWDFVLTGFRSHGPKSYGREETEESAAIGKIGVEVWPNVSTSRDDLSLSVRLINIIYY